MPDFPGRLHLLHRLQTRAQFQAVLAGVVVAKTSHFALHCRRSPDAAVGLTGAVASTKTSTKILAGDAASTQAFVKPSPSVFFHPAELWLGVMVPKRWAKRAVTRNLIKRQTYTVSAQFTEKFPPGAFVVRLRSEFSRREFASAASEALKLAVRNEVHALLLGAGVRL